MSVHVTVMPTAIPPHLRTEEISRQLNYNDGQDFEYVFELLPSGALVVWKGKPGSDVGTAIELVFGPAAWETVQGTPRRDTL